MRVCCEQCGRYYDDAQRWTICPHRPLDETPQPPMVPCEAGGGWEGVGVTIICAVSAALMVIIIGLLYMAAKR